MKPRQAATQHIESQTCTAALKVIGDYWTIRIVQVLGKYSRRFCEIERLLPDSNPVTLTARLKKMETVGLLTRTKVPEDKVCVLYTLTSHGKALLPIATRIEKFAEGFGR